MTIAIDRPKPAARIALLTSPLGLLAAAILLVALLSLLPLSAPIGPMYWDLFIYFDAANRIFDGQIPVVDFFTPVGPLGYYLFAGAVWLFPHAQPALLVHWSLLALTGPLMALVVAHVDGRSRGVGFALLVPFLIFALLPFNTRDFYPFPGSDGFGIYNRQVCQVLYVLIAALMFVRDVRLLAFMVTVCVTALFFLKITGFAAALVVCGFAFVSGRLALKWAFFSALSFLVILAALELFTGLTSHYLGDILALVALNSESLAPRFLQAASHTFGVIAPAGTLILLLLYAGRKKLGEKAAAVRASPRPATVAAFLDNNAFWLGIALFAGILFETQNTGSQAMIFVWPVLLVTLTKSMALIASPKTMIAVLGFVAAAALPPAVNTIERAARAYAGAVKNETLEHRNLKSLGAVNMRDDVLDRSNKMIEFYAMHEPVYEEMVARGKLPTPLLYSNFDFQIVHLMAIDRAIDRIRELEEERGVRFRTIMNMNFVNPFPWLMDRGAPKHIAIGADPTRAVPPPGPLVTEAVRDVDLALLPRCPPTTANADLLALYAPMLQNHRKIELDTCFDAYVHPRLAEQLD